MQVRLATLEDAGAIRAIYNLEVESSTATFDLVGRSLEEQWALERDYTRNVVRGAKAEEAFPEFIARKGRPLPPQKP